MEDVETASAGGQRFLETLNFVVNFLHNEGFFDAERALLTEFEDRFPVSSETSDGSPGYGVGAGDDAAPGGEVESALTVPELEPSTSRPPLEAAALRNNSKGGAMDAAAGPSTSTASNVQVNIPPQAPPPQPVTITELTTQPKQKRPAKKTNRFKSRNPPWDAELDEYDNVDDVGYLRQDIPGQKQFVELELDLSENEGSERYFTHQPGAALEIDDDDEDEEGDDDVSSCDDDEDGASDYKDATPYSSNTSAHHSPSASQSQIQQGRFKREGGIRSGATHQQITLAAGAPARDETWDMGPTDIKFAEPVTTPNRSVERELRDEESKPVLSRVESLSSSFKDFEMERSEEGRQSHQSEADLASDAEVIDFAPPLTEAAITAETLEVFKRPSRTSSDNQLAASAAAASSPQQPAAGTSEATDVVVLAPVIAPAVTSPSKSDTTPSKQEASGGSGGGAGGVGGAGHGGFSFPVTTSPALVEETDPRLFKSWPSVRSSCTSEHGGIFPSDEDELGETSFKAGRSSQPGSTPSPKQQPQGRSSDPGAAGSSSAPASPSTSIDVSRGGSGSSAPVALSLPIEDSGAAEPLPLPADEPASPIVVPTAAAAVPGADKPEAAPAAEPIKPTKDDLGTSSSTPSEAQKEQQPAPSTSALVSEASGSSSKVATDTDAGGEAEDEKEQEQEGDVDGGEADDERGEDEDDEAGSLAWHDVDGQSPGAAGPSGAAGDSAYAANQVAPRYTVDENGVLMYEWDPTYLERKYEVFELRVIHRRQRTGFEETKDFPIRMNDLIAGRYQVMDFLGSAAFSRAVQALDIKTGTLVCLKIIKNNKDYFDQSLDEIKLLKYVNTMDPNDEHGLVRLYDFFYYKEHLFLVCELLRANLYEFQKYNKESGDAPYFTNARIQRIAISVLRSLAFVHQLGLIHSDLKPENILIKSYSRCEVKVIDLGSSCFITDQLSSYVQSRSYRAPEVILGLPYDHKVDVWSLGCILAELSSGFVLFQNDSLATLLARLEGILGPVPDWMIHKGRYASRFFTRSGHIYERSQHSERYEVLVPKRTGLRHRVPDADEGLLDFISFLLSVDPHKRPTAREALEHPWLQQQYGSLDSN